MRGCKRQTLLYLDLEKPMLDAWTWKPLKTIFNWKSDIYAYDYTNPNWEKGARGKKWKKEREREPESRRGRRKSPNAQKTMQPSKCASFFGYDLFSCPWSFNIHGDPSHTSFRNMRCSFQTEDELTKAGWQQNTQHGTATLQSYIVRTDILQSDLTNTFTMQTVPHVFQV